MSEERVSSWHYDSIAWVELHRAESVALDDDPRLEGGEDEREPLEERRPDHGPVLVETCRAEHERRATPGKMERQTCDDVAVVVCEDDVAIAGQAGAGYSIRVHRREWQASEQRATRSLAAGYAALLERNNGRTRGCGETGWRV